MMRKSGELLKWGKTQGSASTEPVIFCCRKTAAATLWRVAAAFCFFCTPTEYYWYDRFRWSGERPEQPSIAVFGVCHKSESLPHRSGLSRFDRRVQPNLSVLEDKWVALFVLRENHKKVKEGCKWHPKRKRPGRRTFCDASAKSWEDFPQRKTSIVQLAPRSRHTLVPGPGHWSLPD